MRLDDEQESTNFEDRTGQRSGGGFGFPGGGGGGLPIGGKMGCGTLVIMIIAGLIFGVNPADMMGGGGGQAPTQQLGPQQAGQAGPDGSTIDPKVRSIVLKVLGSTERRWTDIFTQAGQKYRPTTLVFYTDNNQSGCGAAQAAMGPFYCPADEGIYLDVNFFNELATRFNAGGDFAAAYVIAHEVGHHIQKVTGVADQVRQKQARASQVEGNQLQVRMELQADCYAGVWAARDTNLMEAGDAEEGLRAAQSIGDDTLQKQSQGFVVESAFTHGSSEQRMRWLKRGLTSGDPEQCDTFSGRI
jgi:uncharacterized protein